MKRQVQNAICWVRNPVATVAGITFILLNGLPAVSQPTVNVRVDRFLLIRRLDGRVNYVRGNTVRPAKIGDRLDTIGDGIDTEKASSATLVVDTGIGFLEVLEQTQLRILRLEFAPDNGRITHVNVLRGQVRLRLRAFTNPGSEFEIHTPAGLSGVRGTEFGVSIQPNGKTGVATLSGAVSTSAQNRAISVGAGFQNFTIPGEAPTTPVPLRNDASLSVRLEKIIDRGVRKVRLVGQVDPVNAITIDGQAQSTDRFGRFSALYLAASRLSIRVVVITPLGKSEAYEVALR